jgi:putative endopeptidase
MECEAEREAVLHRLRAHLASNHRPEFARLLAATNEHPLGKFRAIGTVSNMPEFARAFSCDSGAAMVRAMRCQIW